MTAEQKLNVQEIADVQFVALRLRLAKQMSLMFLLVFIFLSFAYFTDSLESFLTMILGIVLSIISTVSVFIWKQYKIPFYIYSIGGVFVTSFALLTFHNTIHFVDLLWIIAAVQLGFFGIGKKMGFVLLGFALLSIALFAFVIVNKHIAAVTPRSYYQEITLIIELLSAFLLNLYFVYLFLAEYELSTINFRNSIQELSKKNAQLLHQNSDKTFLIHEVHYRVKDNLDIISTLLKMQKNEISEPHVKEVFQESINRVSSMLMVHEKLYSGSSRLNASVQDFVRNLTFEIIQLSPYRHQIELHVNCHMPNLSKKTLIPVALIINELTSNSLKYAFDSVSSPIIHVEISVSKETVKMVYFDNGSWKEQSNRSESFGMELIRLLIEQLEGEMKIEKNKAGTMFLFLFPFEGTTNTDF